MSALFFLIIIIGLLVIVHKNLSSKTQKVILTVIILLGSYIVFSIGFSFRFSPIQSAKANAFVEKSSEVIASTELKGNWFFVFKDKNDEGYRTVYVEKLAVGYKSVASTYSLRKSTNKIVTLGEMHMNNAEFYAIRNSDKSIKFVGVYDEQDKQLVLKEMPQDEVIVLAYESTSTQSTSNLLALDENMKAKYYYGYLKNASAMRHEDYQWHDIE